MSERNYYLVPEGSDTADKLAQFRAERQQTLTTWKEFAASYGCDQFLYSNRVEGLKLNECPEGWGRVKAHSGTYKPKAKTAKADYKALNALPSMPGGFELTEQLDAGLTFCDGAIHFPMYENIGDHLVLSLHPDHNVPDDVTPLKKSEYWALKESEAK